MLMNTQEYLSIIENIKQEIKDAQYRAAVHVNTDMLILYYDIGCVINEHKSWGNKFIDNLATDIKIAFPESKGHCLHKFHGPIILQYWKKSKIRNSVYGILKKRLKMDGPIMF